MPLTLGLLRTGWNWIPNIWKLGSFLEGRRATETAARWPRRRDIRRRSNSDLSLEKRRWKGAAEADDSARLGVLTRSRCRRTRCLTFSAAFDVSTQRCAFTNTQSRVGLGLGGGGVVVGLGANASLQAPQKSLLICI